MFEIDFSLAVVAERSKTCFKNESAAKSFEHVKEAIFENYLDNSVRTCANPPFLKRLQLRFDGWGIYRDSESWLSTLGKRADALEMKAGGIFAREYGILKLDLNRSFTHRARNFNRFLQIGTVGDTIFPIICVCIPSHLQFEVGDMLELPSEEEGLSKKLDLNTGRILLCRTTIRGLFKKSEGVICMSL